MNAYDVIIVGSGPAGISSLIWCQRLGLHTILLEKGTDIGGQLHQSYNQIIDYPGFISEVGGTLDAQMLIARFRQHTNALGCQIRTECPVREIDLDNNVLRSECGEFKFRFLILATGARERKLNVPGEAEMMERNEIYSTSNQLSQLKGKRVAIVGGGDRAFEGALKAADVSSNVYLFHRSDQFRARQEYIQPVFNHVNIKVFKHCEITKILGNEKVTGVCYHNLKSGHVNQLNVDVVLIRIGVEPNSELLHQQAEISKEGFVLTNRYGKSSLPHVYAVGDVTTFPEFSSISNSVGQGMVAAKSIALELQSGGKTL